MTSDLRYHREVLKLPLHVEFNTKYMWRTVDRRESQTRSCQKFNRLTCLRNGQRPFICQCKYGTDAFISVGVSQETSPYHYRPYFNHLNGVSVTLHNPALSVHFQLTFCCQKMSCTLEAALYETGSLKGEFIPSLKTYVRGITDRGQKGTKRPQGHCHVKERILSKPS